MKERAWECEGKVCKCVHLQHAKQRFRNLERKSSLCTRRYCTWVSVQFEWTTFKGVAVSSGASRQEQCVQYEVRARHLHELRIILRACSENAACTLSQLDIGGRFIAQAVEQRLKRRQEEVMRTWQ